MPQRRAASSASESYARHGIARVLSKRGFCSRSRAAAMVREGRVTLNGRIVRDPETPALPHDRITVDGAAVNESTRVYLMLNKPRGLVTTASDEKGRETVFRCLDGAGLPHLSPVGRLDQASEGLLLFTNDTAWADALTSPHRHVAKIYHVHIDAVASGELCRGVESGVHDEGEFLAASSCRVLREGPRNSWLEIVLHEGRNRHIRRLLATLGVEVLRLVRVSVGPLALGTLKRGQWRLLTEGEVRELMPD